MSNSFLFSLASIIARLEEDPSTHYTADCVSVCSEGDSSSSSESDEDNNNDDANQSSDIAEDELECHERVEAVKHAQTATNGGQQLYALWQDADLELGNQTDNDSSSYISNLMLRIKYAESRQNIANNDGDLDVDDFINWDLYVTRVNAWRKSN
ncbi:hypothetical protein BCR33DRAFT_296257 [Rhizoclosmatium globosum]|uniref:Uncharacterized protein n=1 Tax=Rhizoclosmatium globosum TaxID=329046 RepID=A0A1Y2C627_9FUNG|nr:hypothetical protein BCR33DRAFT_296257 [Rhizoclosmatium globosum]|eukprot:ORY42493.1 hypothetical protein BCR33DRAFT_296257 [Rhizoclosmatium globosum]